MIPAGQQMARWFDSGLLLCNYFERGEDTCSETKSVRFAETVSVYGVRVGFEENS